MAYQIVYLFVLILLYFTNVAHFQDANYDNWTHQRFELLLDRQQARDHCASGGGHLAMFKSGFVPPPIDTIFSRK